MSRFPTSSQTPLQPRRVLSLQPSIKYWQNNWTTRMINWALDQANGKTQQNSSLPLQPPLDIHSPLHPPHPHHQRRELPRSRRRPRTRPLHHSPRLLLHSPSRAPRDPSRYNPRRGRNLPPPRRHRAQPRKGHDTHRQAGQCRRSVLPRYRGPIGGSCSRGREGGGGVQEGVDG